MEFTRRGAMALSAGLAAALMLPASAVRAAVEDKIAEFTGGADAGADGITLTTPEIAENGNTVPIEVEAPGAVEIMVVASANPTPDVARVSFGPLAGAQRLSTRIRLGGTQDVIAVAKMGDGSFRRASNTVKVTIGGCGG
ncbi:thiosulfate oxidation carrier protein SoxY [Rhodovulum sulfidophilum]|uniref:thiosulfate oxidation carrier protein SoxY n=1 Tax=Rhodovulum sulfidophilum TaxID=35806 RepID=UPI001921860F|nr:thiosulfate oxidation carrier protein SoxY [Rhodovulum sulfidophilum]MBL3562708.1 thiosulfate oxidation carrier protein SoxY [Rhodovulum sulfidophilum]MBL3566768.1 thiosulfate oxidation carrier protein SoxY [Rhodovulum sulfidophilum]